MNVTLPGDKVFADVIKGLEMRSFVIEDGPYMQVQVSPRERTERFTTDTEDRVGQGPCEDGAETGPMPPAQEQLGTQELEEAGRVLPWSLGGGLKLVLGSCPRAPEQISLC